MGIFDILAVPLGYILWFIYRFIGNYFISIFLFTLVVRAATFPLSLKSQKSQADRAKLAPRLERLQKKYAQDKQKLQQKQMELYEKEGVSMTGGCLPMVIQMVVLMGIISVIYMPLTHLARIPAPVIQASISAVQLPTEKNAEGKDVEVAPEKAPGKVKAGDLTGYYRELRMMKALDANKADVVSAIDALAADQRGNKSGQAYYDQMLYIRQDFMLFGQSMLDSPWTEKGFGGISPLWLIPLLSWLTALGSSLISMRYTKMATTPGEKQPGQGCSNVMLIGLMPLFSLFITFTVPGGVGIYWICSNLIAVVQTIILNTIYNPVKIRAQAQAEYEERRRRKAEDKKRLAEARMREEEEARRLAKEEEQQKVKAREEAAAAARKPKTPTKNPNKLKKKEAAAAAQDSLDEAEPEPEESAAIESDEAPDETGTTEPGGTQTMDDTDDDTDAHQ